MFDQPLRELNAEIDNIETRFQNYLGNIPGFSSIKLNDVFGGRPRDRNYIFKTEDTSDV